MSNKSSYFSLKEYITQVSARKYTYMSVLIKDHMTLLTEQRNIENIFKKIFR